MWVSNPETYYMPYVIFGRNPANLDTKSYAITNTYNVGHVGFQGKVYKAVMRGLQPLTKYYYRVGDEKAMTYS